MRRLADRIGITGVRVSPHTCRHTFAITFLRNGGSLLALQRILGHQDLAMVRVYAELTDTDLAAERRVVRIEACPSSIWTSTISAPRSNASVAPASPDARPIDWELAYAILARSLLR
jgi:hypothetical protein